MLDTLEFVIDSGASVNIIGISKLKDFQFETYVDETVKPVAQPCRIPFQLCQQVNLKIKKLKTKEIIEKRDGPTPWVSPIVAAPEAHFSYEIWLCVAKQGSETTTLTIDEITSDLNGATVFSKLELLAEYH